MAFPISFFKCVSAVTHGSVQLLISKNMKEKAKEIAAVFYRLQHIKEYVNGVALESGPYTTHYDYIIIKNFEIFQFSPVSIFRRHIIYSLIYFTKKKEN